MARVIHCSAFDVVECAPRPDKAAAVLAPAMNAENPSGNGSGPVSLRMGLIPKGLVDPSAMSRNICKA